MEETNEIPDVRPLAMRYRQGRSLEDVVWTLLLGSEQGNDLYYTPVVWSQKEIRERLALIFSDYDRMVREVRDES